MQQSLIRGSRGETLIATVMQTIRERIDARSLPPGAKLPSIREFALAKRISKSTVVEAYERLIAEGVIRSRPGSGYYVAAPLAPLSLAAMGPKLEREIDPLWISRQSLEADDGVLRPGCGWLPASWMPHEAIRRGLRTMSRGEDALLADYATPLGLPPLRELLARRMGEQGINVSPDNVILTESGTHALDLMCRFLIEPGDTVLVDDPCYFNFHALLRVHRANVIGVPYTPIGPDIDAFGKILTEHSPRLYITNSALHNPTSAILSPVVAHRILKLAAETNLTIIEDDIFADFEVTPAPRLAAFDGLERVVQIGSFSKTLSASARCGFMAVKSDWIDALVDLKLATNFSSSNLSAALVLTLLKDGSYRKHLAALRQRLDDVRPETVTRLKSIGIVPWADTHAGMFLWCRLPGGIDAADMARRALADHVVLAPGNAFSLSKSAAGFMRFNIAQSTDRRIFATLEKAMKTT